MFLGLRLTEGVSFARFRERFGQEMKNIYGSQIEELVKDGLLEEDEMGIRLTRRGVDISNYVFEKFLFWYNSEEFLKMQENEENFSF